MRFVRSLLKHWQGTPDKKIILALLGKISDPSWIVRKQAKRALIEQGDSIYNIIQGIFHELLKSAKIRMYKNYSVNTQGKGFYIISKNDRSRYKGREFTAIHLRRARRNQDRGFYEDFVGFIG